MKDPAHTRSVGLLLACALLWSVGGMLIKAVAWPPFAVGGGRALIAGLFLLVVHRRRRFTWSRLEWAGAVAYFGATVPFAAATKLTTAANAIFLQYTAPIWVALFAEWLLGERPTRADWVALLLVLCGLGLFFAHGIALRGAFGIILALFSGVSFAALAMVTRKQRDGSAVESVILGNFLGAAVGLPFALGHPLPPPSGLLALLLLGTVQLGLPYLLYTRALRHVTALEAVLTTVIEPILNPVWVLLFIGEKPTVPSLIGGALILSAVVGRSLFPRPLPLVG